MKRLLVLLLLLSVTITVTAQDTRYFLLDSPHPQFENYELLDFTNPTGSIARSINLDQGAGHWATDPVSSDIKINGDVEINVFFEALFSFVTLESLPVQFRVIKATLLDIPPSGNAAIIDATNPELITFRGNVTVKAYTFNLDNVEYVLSAGHCLGIKIEKSLDIFSKFPFSFLSPFFSTFLLYDATYTKSYVSVPFNATGAGIELECFSTSKEVRPGNSALYNVIVYNHGDQADTVTINASYDGPGWSVDIEQPEVTIAAGGFVYSDVTVTAPATAGQDAFLNLTLIAQGSFGSDTLWLNTSISPPKYGVTVEALNKTIEAEPGDIVSFSFRVKNTGDLTDTYEFGVSCVWDYSISAQQVTLTPNNSTLVTVSVTIPENAAVNATQVVSLTAQSANKEATATSTLKVAYTPTPTKEKEDILTPVLWVLFIIGVVFILALAYYLGRATYKMVTIECDDRVAEISPGSTAAFTIHISNPLDPDEKNTQTYHLKIDGRIPEQWRASLTEENITLEGGAKSDINLIIEIPESSSMDEWTSLDVVATPKKGKPEKVNILITLREPHEDLRIELTHTPEDFKENDRVVTRVVIENIGEKDAIDKNVILIVNGKEKNRIEGVTIPPKARVEIQLPWIAEEENDIVVKAE